jgi:hypothetical protein
MAGAEVTCVLSDRMAHNQKWAEGTPKSRQSEQPRET